MAKQIEGTVATSAGMFLLWNPDRFQSVIDYDTWETELLEDEDIERHIADGSVVPITIGADGAFAMVIRVGSAAEPAALTEREIRYLTTSSEPYVLGSDGRACLTGIEDVRSDPGSNSLSFALPSGRWSVTVHLIAWDDEPGARDATGEPGPNALPDFVLLLTPETSPPVPYRTEVETFASR